MCDREAKRRLLIALNCNETIRRESICKLARQPEAWSGRRRSLLALSREIGVPKTELQRAQRIADTACPRAAAELTKADRMGAEILTMIDSAYPQTLSQLELPPPVLYVRGRLPSQPSLAIVGSRVATRAGLAAAELFARDLAASGLVIVSGLARGVDQAAHRAALGTQEGLTVAVLGCGLDVDYPRGRGRLVEEIARRGAVLTEFPPGTPPLARNFPVRNRIIAALSLGTLVVQGTPQSGSLITARLALDLGRDVYAVPGSIFDLRSEGPNTLIRDGALLVQHPRDVLESLPINLRQLLQEIEDQPQERLVTGQKRDILRALPADEPVTADRVARLTCLTLDQVLGHLLELELAGLVRRYPGSAYCRLP